MIIFTDYFRKAAGKNSISQQVGKKQITVSRKVREGL